MLLQIKSKILYFLSLAVDLTLKIKGKKNCILSKPKGTESRDFRLQVFFHVTFVALCG